MKKILVVILIFFSCSSLAQAACDFIIDIGDKGTKVFEKFAPPIPGFKGQFYLPIQSQEVFKNSYPKYEEWLSIKKDLDPKNIFYSDLSKRLKIEY